jgi:hypothetical protein
MESLADRLKSPAAWRRDLALAAFMAVFFTLIGPFGSYAEPLPRRFAQCVAYSFIGLPVWAPCFRILLWLAERRNIPQLIARPLAALIVTGPVALAVWLVAILGGGRTPPNPLSIWLQVSAIALPVALASALLRQRAPPPSPDPAADQPPRLHARLPAAVDAPILALQGEDHYVRVHTQKGSALILMRMSDAIAELDGQPGLQVHRSWWVARAAVAGAAKTGRRAEITLSNGLSVPVARNAMPQARAAGYLAVRA